MHTRATLETHPFRRARRLSCLAEASLPEIAKRVRLAFGRKSVESVGDPTLSRFTDW